MPKKASWSSSFIWRPSWRARAFHRYRGRRIRPRFPDSDLVPHGCRTGSPSPGLVRRHARRRRSHHAGTVHDAEVGGFDLIPPVVVLVQSLLDAPGPSGSSPRPIRRCHNLCETVSEHRLSIGAEVGFFDLIPPSSNLRVTRATRAIESGFPSIPRKAYSTSFPFYLLVTRA